MNPRNDRTSFALLIDSRRLVAGKQLGNFFYGCLKPKAKKKIMSTSIQSLEAIKQTKACNQSTAREKLATGAKRWKMCLPVALWQNM